jgi:phosphoribosylformylglycinamidine synthase
MIKNISQIPTASKQELSIRYGQKKILSMGRSKMQQYWSATSHQMQRIHDNIDCSDAEFENIKDNLDRGLHYKLTFNPKDTILHSRHLSHLFLPRHLVLRY